MRESKTVTTTSAITEITEDRFAELFESMFDVVTVEQASMIAHAGQHPDLGAIALTMTTMGDYMLTKLASA